MIYSTLLYEILDWIRYLIINTNGLVILRTLHIIIQCEVSINYTKYLFPNSTLCTYQMIIH